MGDNREIKIHVYSKRQTWICTAWQSFSLNCLLLLLKNFIPVLYLRIVLDSFYLLVFCSEKFSTWISLLPFAVNANLNLANWNFAARKWKQARKPIERLFFLSFFFFFYFWWYYWKVKTFFCGAVSYVQQLRNITRGIYANYHYKACHYRPILMLSNYL